MATFRHWKEDRLLNQYKTELTRAMTMLGEDPRTIFVGQSLLYGGTGMSETFSGVPREKIIEFPVAEEMQMGVCNGLALAGFIPVCVFPRMNFMLLAISQLANHLNHMQMKVLIRVAVGSNQPLDPGPAHTGDYTTALLHLCPNIEIYRLIYNEFIVDSFKSALKTPGPSILIEYMEKYEA